MTKTILPSLTLFMDSWIIFSDFVSKLAVASSNNKISGFLKIALATAILCFCPPDKFLPRSPIIVSNF